MGGRGAGGDSQGPLNGDLGMSPLVLTVLSSNYSNPIRIPVKDCWEKGEHPNHTFNIPSERPLLSLYVFRSINFDQPQLRKTLPEQVCGFEGS